MLVLDVVHQLPHEVDPKTTDAPLLDRQRHIRHWCIVQVERVTVLLDGDLDVRLIESKLHEDPRMARRRVPLDVVDDLVEHHVKVMTHVVRHAVR